MHATALRKKITGLVFLKRPASAGFEQVGAGSLQARAVGGRHVGVAARPQHEDERAVGARVRLVQRAREVHQKLGEDKNKQKTNASTKPSGKKKCAIKKLQPRNRRPAKTTQNICHANTHDTRKQSFVHF
jgi:hypothetical protein